MPNEFDPNRDLLNVGDLQHVGAYLRHRDLQTQPASRKRNFPWPRTVGQIDVVGHGGLQHALRLKYGQQDQNDTHQCGTRI